MEPSDVVLSAVSAPLLILFILLNVGTRYTVLASAAVALATVALLFVRTGGQVLAAGALALAVYTLLSWFVAMKADPGEYTRPVSQREAVPIFKGTMQASSGKDKVYNTTDVTSGTFRRLSTSFNRQGGTQFSYSVWVKFERGVSDQMLAGKTLFMRGDARRYSPALVPSQTWATQSGAGAEAVQGGSRCLFNPDLEGGSADKSCSDYLIMCPRVSFLKKDQIAVDINTDRQLLKRFKVGSSESAERSLRQKALILLPGHFVMLTFVFEDNVGIDRDAFEKGIRFSFFMNDQLYHTETCEGSIRQNPGHLYLLPGTLLEDCRLADFTYHNYALGPDDVSRLYRGGYSTADANASSRLMGNKRAKLELSAYNKTDLYNYSA